MYNEVDQLILDNFVICPHCENNNVECLGITTTIASIGIYIDTNNRSHEHDSNRMSAQYKCANGHQFVIEPINSCWCGWRQKK